MQTLSSEHLDFINQLALLLGETQKVPIAQLGRIVERCGIDQAATWLNETKQIEGAGGELISNGRRRRTPGGVFFRIVRDAVSDADGQYIFPKWSNSQHTKDRATEAAALAPPALPVATWAERDAVINEAQQHPGKAHTVKITIIGKVGKAVERQGFTLLTLQHDGKLPALPKGIPTPAQTVPTSYILYIGGKQWNKVKEALRNPDDVLIAEGTPVLDPKYNAITVFVTNAGTKLLQQAQRDQQKAASEG